ncbi:MAG: hypothetical protein M1828_006513 [Chrysothrix sp. TS-e1954]|nr:MAG: hypothetical protein M1828_006513 [Chrysothrix sp. TS-e1954]
MGRPRKTEAPRKRRRGDEAEEVQQDAASNYITPDTSSSSTSQTGLDPALLNEPLNGDEIAWEMYDQDVAHGSEDFANGILPLADDLSGVASVGSSNQHITAPNLDPSGPCSCLSNMYLAASNLGQTGIGIGFPFALAQIKSANNTASDILFCDYCPRHSDSARQNILLINTLLATIATTCDRILRDVDAEAARARATGEKKTFRMGDNSPGLAHLHTGTLDCPLGFDIELGAQEWRSLAFRAIKGEVFDRGVPRMTLEKLCTQLEDRQRSWHEQHMAKGTLFGKTVLCHPNKTPEHTCLKLTQQIRGQIADFPN